MEGDLFDWAFFLEQEVQAGERFFLMSGSDEVGRGPLAGPVVACTVMVKGGPSALLSFLLRLKNLGIKDSKKMTPALRQKLVKRLGFTPDGLREDVVYGVEEGREDAVWSLASVSPADIDQINIHKASLLAMKKSLKLCFESAPGPGISLVDGCHRIPEIPPGLSQFPLVGGDGKSLLIGLASILAKEYRDHHMASQHEKFPYYGWNKNAGYPTKLHQEGLQKWGPSPLHRKTFAGVKEFFNDGLQ